MKSNEGADKRNPPEGILKQDTIPKPGGLGKQGVICRMSSGLRQAFVQRLSSDCQGLVRSCPDLRTANE
jgi:hypothetical protein